MFEATEGELFSTGILSSHSFEKAVLRRRGYDPHEEYEKLKKSGIGFVSREHPQYPERLRQIAGGPLGLFYKGELPEN